MAAVALVAVLGLISVGLAAGALSIATGAQIAGLVVPAALLLGLWLRARQRTRRPHERTRPRRRDAMPSQWLTDLDAHASQALLHADDCVRTSNQELGVAASRIGQDQAAAFRAAVTSARAELAAAFRLRQLLDDGIPRTNAVRQSMMLDVNSRCTEVSRLLDEQVASFDAAQDRADHGPRILAETEAFVDQQSARLERSRHTLTQLAARYSPQAIEPVALNPDLAAALLRLAADNLAAAAKLLDTDESGPGDEAARFQAVRCLQVAETAAGQATALLDGIKHQEAELTQAASALPAAVREISADLAEAEPVLGDGPASALSRARAAVVDAAREQLDGGPFDALAALRAVEQACTALDHALAKSRAEPVRQHRAEAILDQAMLLARSSVRTAEDFVATRRGAVGSPARTRLAAAWQHFDQAIDCVQSDPRAALNAARQADGLAHQAAALAMHDAAAFDVSGGQMAVRAGLLAGILIGPADHPGADGHLGRASNVGADSELGPAGDPGSDFNAGLAGERAADPGGSPGPAGFGGLATRARLVPRHTPGPPAERRLESEAEPNPVTEPQPEAEPPATTEHHDPAQLSH
ncbi:MAG TPA: hypothetical protein VGI58_07895 [Streptosporangiaceae bacterium]